MPNQEPVILELAPLPREQIGPFLLLGLDKDADKEQIEACWAKRVIWARKSQIRLALEDINWAREVVNDPEKRIRADAASLNADTAEKVVARLCKRYNSTEQGRPPWQPLDREKELADYTPAVEVPDPDVVRTTIALPEIPPEMPAAANLLQQAVQQPLDPWNLEL
jgi:hypothetical protein